MRKIIAIILVIMFCVIPVATFADDYEEEETIPNEEILNVSTSVENIPNINSRACLIYDIESGRVLYQKNGYTKRPMASTTKIMTATIVLENANLQDTVEVSKKAAGTGGSRLGLKAKDRITVNDLLYGLMMRSRK